MVTSLYVLHTRGGRRRATSCSPACGSVEKYQRLYCCRERQKTYLVLLILLLVVDSPTLVILYGVGRYDYNTVMCRIYDTEDSLLTGDIGCRASEHVVPGSLYYTRIILSIAPAAITHDTPCPPTSYFCHFVCTI